MLKQVTREVVSIEDAKEMAYDGKIIAYQITDNGYNCTFLEEDKNPEISAETSKNWIVFCDTGSGRIYASEHGISFYPNEAKHFSKEAAKSKAYFMILNGIYDWRAEAL